MTRFCFAQTHRPNFILFSSSSSEAGWLAGWQMAQTSHSRLTTTLNANPPIFFPFPFLSNFTSVPFLSRQTFACPSGGSGVLECKDLKSGKTENVRTKTRVPKGKIKYHKRNRKTKKMYGERCGKTRAASCQSWGETREKRRKNEPSYRYPVDKKKRGAHRYILGSSVSFSHAPLQALSLSFSQPRGSVKTHHAQKKFSQPVHAKNNTK